MEKLLIIIVILLEAYIRLLPFLLYFAVSSTKICSVFCGKILLFFFVPLFACLDFLDNNIDTSVYLYLTLQVYGQLQDG